MPADQFAEVRMGRIARPPADNEEASVYWEDKWDARGKRFQSSSALPAAWSGLDDTLAE
jgi:hypothetical protein